MNRRIRLLFWLLIFVLGMSACGAKKQSEEKKVPKAVQSSAGNTMTVTFLDVGQGDCTIVREGEYVMMIDAGDNGAGEVVLQYLKEQGIEKLDYFILTHPDSDHVGGADMVINAVTVDKILMPDAKNDTKTFRDVKKAVADKGIPITNPSVGDTYKLDKAEFAVLCPEKTSRSDLNNSSVGIRLVHGKKSFVLCGDAEEKSETTMVSRFGDDLESDVLKCGHHGSHTATSDAFLESVDPTWAIISCGKSNRYGHPHAEVIAKLEDDDVQVYRTDKQGGITATSDGERISWH